MYTYLQEYKKHFICISTKCIVKLSICCRFTPESIQWLLVNGQSKKVQEIIHDAAKTNGITIDHQVFHGTQSTVQTPPHTTTVSDGDPLITEGDEFCVEDNYINHDNPPGHVPGSYTNHGDCTEYVPGPYNDSRALDGASSPIKVTLKGQWERLTNRKHKADRKPEHQYGIRDMARSAVMRNYTIYLSIIW